METKTIYQKLLAVQKGIDTMSKDGTNTFSNYKYLMEAQITTNK